MSDEHDPVDQAEDGERHERRGRLRDSVPDVLRKILAQGVEALGEEKIKETLVAELFRKAVSKGGEVVDTTEDSLRRLIAELPLPKEVAERLISRADDYKSEILRLVMEEVRAFLDRVDIGYELQKVLTSLSFEISTEIRFVPNERSVKPEVRARTRVKKTRRREDEDE